MPESNRKTATYRSLTTRSPPLSYRRPIVYLEEHVSNLPCMTKIGFDKSIVEENLQQ